LKVALNTITLILALHWTVGLRDSFHDWDNFSNVGHNINALDKGWCLIFNPTYSYIFSVEGEKMHTFKGERSKEDILEFVNKAQG